MVAREYACGVANRGDIAGGSTICSRRHRAGPLTLLTNEANRSVELVLSRTL
jgi:hypothetical protein